MSLVSFIGPRPNILDLEGTWKQKRLEVSPAHPDQRGAGAHPQDLAGAVHAVPHDHAGHHLQRASGRGGHGAFARLAVQPGGNRCAAGLEHHRPVRPRNGAGPHRDPEPARDQRDPSSPDPQGPAHLGRPCRRDRRSARDPSVRGSGRLWRGGDQPLSRLRNHRGESRRSRKAHREGRSLPPLCEGHRQGPHEGDVQDGHLDLSVLLRRADLRRGWPQIGLRGQVVHGHAHRHRRRGPRRDRGRDRRAPPARLRRRAGLEERARRGRRVCLPHARRGACLEPGHHRRPSARRARQFGGKIPLVRESAQRSVREADDDPRPVPLEGRQRDRPRAHSARRGRAGQGDREALRDRCDVLRLDQPRGAHDARHRHEPDRRQIQYRRRRRGAGPLQAAAEWRQRALGHQAGGLGAVRRDHRIPRQLRHDADQDGAGGQARRGRPAPRP